MFRAIFAKEILEALAGRRFWTILVLCLILVPLGVEVSLRDYRTRLQNTNEAVRIYQEETKTASDVLYKEGAKAFAPPSSLSFLSLGLELVLPKIAESEYKFGEGPSAMRLSNNQGRDNLYEYFYGPLDLVFIVGVIMSFLAIVLTYGTGDLDRNAPAPKFPPDAVTIEKRLTAVWIDLALLGVYGILFFAGAYVAFLRYDVR